MRFLLELKARDCDREFGLGPGVLATREVDFETDTAEVWQLAVALYELQGEMVEEHIEVVVPPMEES